MSYSFYRTDYRGILEMLLRGRPDEQLEVLERVALAVRRELIRTEVAWARSQRRFRKFHDLCGLGLFTGRDSDSEEFPA